jgi:predicted PurR-regulated permease PerM
MVANPIQALWFVVMFLVIQQFEGNVIYPRVVGTSIGLPGMWVLLAISVGGELFGVVGMFLMIPLSSVIYALIRQWINGRLEKRTLDDEKLTPQPPDIYSNRIPIFRKKKKK